MSASVSTSSATMDHVRCCKSIVPTSTGRQPWRLEYISDGDSNRFKQVSIIWLSSDHHLRSNYSNSETSACHSPRTVRMIKYDHQPLRFQACLWCFPGWFNLGNKDRREWWGMCGITATISRITIIIVITITLYIVLSPATLTVTTIQTTKKSTSTMDPKCHWEVGLAHFVSLPPNKEVHFFAIWTH